MIELPNNTNSLSSVMYMIAKASNNITQSIQSNIPMNELEEWCVGFEACALTTIEEMLYANTIVPSITWIDKITQYYSDNQIKINDLSSPFITKRMIAELVDHGFNSTEFAHLGRFLIMANNVLRPPETNYVYFKLETGGLNGYDYDTQLLGAKEYPILSLTLAINNNPPETFIIQQSPEALAKISKYALQVHGESGLLLQCHESSQTLDDVATYIRAEFRRHGIKPTNPQSNYHTILVAYGADFITDFMRHQMRSIFTYFSPKTLDVVRATAGYTPMGIASIFQPLLYPTGDEYIDGLRTFTINNNLVKITH